MAEDYCGIEYDAILGYLYDEVNKHNRHALEGTQCSDCEIVSHRRAMGKKATDHLAALLDEIRSTVILYAADLREKGYK